MDELKTVGHPSSRIIIIITHEGQVEVSLDLIGFIYPETSFCIYLLFSSSNIMTIYTLVCDTLLRILSIRILSITYIINSEITVLILSLESKRECGVD